MHRVTLALAGSLVALGIHGAAIGQDVAAGDRLALHRRSVVRFASVAEGRKVVTCRDAFIGAMSPFDRQARLKTDRAVSTDEHLKFAAAQVLPWNQGEKQKVAGVIKAIRGQLAAWNLPLPGEVLLVKTTGKEEGSAAYCRGAAIVLPRHIVTNRRQDQLQRLLTHELFHILSSQNPKLRDRLYAVVGFSPCGPVELPKAMRDRKITNPDAPRVEHRITVAVGGRKIDVVPVLYSTSRYDPRRGSDFFRYMNFRLMTIRKQGERWTPVLVDGKPLLHKAPDVPSYHEQIGRNTRYIIHPEEVLADNFVLLMQGKKDVATPRILQAMGKVLGK